MPEKQTVVRGALVLMFSDILGLLPEQVEFEATFDEDFGIGEEEAVVLRDAMNKRFDLDIPLVVWKEMNTLHDVMDYLRRMGKV